jgi:hypothetical protein
VYLTDNFISFPYCFLHGKYRRTEVTGIRKLAKIKGNQESRNSNITENQDENTT